jgi:hypothetical protein
MTKAATADLLAAEPTQELATRREDSFALMVERLATNKDVDVDKLSKILDLQERIIDRDARAEFFAAFAAMQGDLPSITERGEILVNGQVRSKYAKNEDIQEAVRPVLQRHGFALTFRNEFKDNLLRITGVLAHRSGHTEQDEFIAKADTSGSKNDIQALGSTRSYGQRYTTIALLNIVTKGQDDDGARSQARPDVKAPEGFENWWLDLEALADNGLAHLQDGWNKSKADHKRHLLQTNRNGWETLKRKAAKVGA